MKTSKQWVEQVQAKFPDFKVLDPDGWDRSNYEYSFNEELITAEEFQKRVFFSTTMSGRGVFQFISELE